MKYTSEIVNQTTMANYAAMVTCNSFCSGTCSRSSYIVGNYLYPMVVCV